MTLNIEELKIGQTIWLNDEPRTIIFLAKRNCIQNIGFVETEGVFNTRHIDMNYEISYKRPKKPREEIFHLWIKTPINSSMPSRVEYITDKMININGFRMHLDLETWHKIESTRQIEIVKWKDDD